MHGHAEWINIINYCMGPDNYHTSCTNLLSQYVQYFKIHGFHIMPEITDCMQFD